jgi:hypothetical protein
MRDDLVDHCVAAAPGKCPAFGWIHLTEAAAGSQRKAGDRRCCIWDGSIGMCSRCDARCLQILPLPVCSLFVISKPCSGRLMNAADNRYRSRVCSR